MTPDAFRCSDASLGRDEPIYGTASVVRRWLLVEQPGAWGGNALLQSKMPARIAKELRARAAACGVRIVLIRRGSRLSTGRRQCYFLRTEDCDTYAGHLSVDSPTDLVDIDLSPLRDGGTIVDAEPVERPVFLVCTHGKHDACCSIKGNQVSRIACAQPDVDAWECSHIGGDRFAANLVCFPHGVYYGRVQPDKVVGLMSAFSAGEISMEHYRGRCCFSFPEQAAEYFARRETGELAVDGVTLTGSEVAEGHVTARFSIGGRTARVELSVSTAGRHRLTCGAENPLPIPRYDLAAFDLA